MCISQSVGNRGINSQSDVQTVQSLLNLNLFHLAPLSPLKVDGQMGPITIAAIEEFQRRRQNMNPPTGRMEPGDSTVQELRTSYPKQLSASILHTLMPEVGAALVSRYLDPLIAGMNATRINTPLRIAHFLAQLGHESGDLQYAEELASGEDYEGRADLGNTQPGDGPKFKGRGLIQLTGRSNYVAYGKYKGRDFVTPTNYRLVATDPYLAVDVSCWYWTTHGLNALADNDDIKAITRVINGGLNGLPDRQVRLTRAKCFLLG